MGDIKLNYDHEHHKNKLKQIRELMVLNPGQDIEKLLNRIGLTKKTHKELMRLDQEYKQGINSTKNKKEKEKVLNEMQRPSDPNKPMIKKTFMIDETAKDQSIISFLINEKEDKRMIFYNKDYVETLVREIEERYRKILDENGITTDAIKAPNL